MPKASFDPSKATKGGVGIQEGNVVITAAVSKIHQYPPNKETGQQGDPFPCVQIEFARLDADFDLIPDEATETVEYSIGNSNRFRPGQASSRDDENPEDLGTEVDVIGNTIYSVDGSEMNQNCKWMIFTDALVKCGFKAEVLGTGWLPDLIGTKGHVFSKSLPKIPNSTSTKDRLCVVFDKIVEKPYEAKAKGKAAKPAQSVKTTTPTPSEAAASSAPVTSSAFEDTAKEMLKKVAVEKAGSTLPYAKVFTAVQMVLMKNAKTVPTVNHRPILETVKRAGFLEEFGEESGLFVADGAEVVFG